MLQWTKWVRFCAQVRPNLMSGFNNLRIVDRGFWLSSKIKMVV